MHSQELPSLEGYRLLKMSFVQGEVFEFFIPHGWTPQKTRSYLAHVEGEVECRRTQHGLVDTKRPGDTTSTAPGLVQQLGPLPGRLTYKVQTPTYTYLCLTRNDGQPIVVRDVWLEASTPTGGVVYTVPVGKVALLVLSGDLTTYREGDHVSSSDARKLLLEVSL